jgi:hypothetical protein
LPGSAAAWRTPRGTAATYYEPFRRVLMWGNLRLFLHPERDETPARRGREPPVRGV